MESWNAKPRPKSVLESVYKSSTFRTLALAAALFGGALETSRVVEKHEQRKATMATEMLDKDGLRLEDLATKFRPEIEVPSGEKTILHIAQRHFVPEVETDAKVHAGVVESQKHIEQLLLYLQENGLADTVYVEGVTSEYKSWLDDVKTRVNLIQAQEPEDVFAESETISATALQFASPEELEGEEFQKKQTADWFYAAACELDREYSRLQEEYQTFIQTRHATERYEKTFEKLTEEGTSISQRIESVRLQKETLAKNTLIHGDEIYLWGAAEKLYAEGKIKLEVVETSVAREETQADLSPLDKIVTLPIGFNKAAYRHRLREDVAIDLINQRAPTEKLIPLVYGNGHDFTEAVEAFNAQVGATQFGLSKLTPEKSPR